MAKAPGRLAVLAKNATPIAGITSVNIKLDATPMDVTDFLSLGVQTLLPQQAKTSLTIECEGFVDSPVLRDIMLNATGSKTLTDLTFKFADALTAADTVSGTFFLSSYEENNPLEEASDFKATFMSASAWTVG